MGRPAPSPPSANVLRLGKGRKEVPGTYLCGPAGWQAQLSPSGHPPPPAFASWPPGLVAGVSSRVSLPLTSSHLLLSSWCGWKVGRLLGVWLPSFPGDCSGALKRQATGMQFDPKAPGLPPGPGSATTCCEVLDMSETLTPSPWACDPGFPWWPRPCPASDCAPT